MRLGGRLVLLAAILRRRRSRTLDARLSEQARAKEGRNVDAVDDVRHAGEPSRKPPYDAGLALMRVDEVGT